MLATAITSEPFELALHCAVLIILAGSCSEKKQPQNHGVFHSVFRRSIMSIISLHAACTWLSNHTTAGFCNRVTKLGKKAGLQLRCHLYSHLFRTWHIIHWPVGNWRPGNIQTKELLTPIPFRIKNQREKGAIRDGKTHNCPHYCSKRSNHTDVDDTIKNSCYPTSWRYRQHCQFCIKRVSAHLRERAGGTAGIIIRQFVKSETPFITKFPWKS